MKYRFLCTDCGNYKYKESLLIDLTCPENQSHIVDENTISIVTNNDNLDPIHDCKKDYRKQRRDLINYVIENFSNLTQEELQVASEHFAVPKEIRDQFFSINEQIKLGEDFNRRATKSRQLRFELVLSIFFNRYTYEQTTDIIGALTADSLIFNYVNLGVEGTTESDPVGIFDYIESTSGTKFENNGLYEESYSPIGITKEDLITQLMHVLRNGCLDVTCSGNCGF